MATAHRHTAKPDENAVRVSISAEPSGFFATLWRGPFREDRDGPHQSEAGANRAASAMVEFARRRAALVSDAARAAEEIDEDELERTER
jgi:hypothetical protein